MLSDAEKRKQYDEARRLFGSGGFRPAGGFGGGSSTFDLGDLFGGAQAGGAGSGGIGDLLGGLFGGRGRAGAASANRARRGDRRRDRRADRLHEAVQRRHRAAADGQPGRLRHLRRLRRPAGHHRRGPARSASGAGLVSRSQGAFALSEPCRDCRGTGQIIDDPCPECGGEGVSTEARTLTMRIPAGVDDGQRIRLAGQGEPGRNGGPNGDLFVRVHVAPHPVFGRSGDDLTVTVPVSFPELVIGTTLTVPTLDSKVK